MLSLQHSIHLRLRLPPHGLCSRTLVACMSLVGITSVGESELSAAATGGKLLAYDVASSPMTLFLVHRLDRYHCNQ